MMKSVKMLAVAATLVVLASSTAMATPSTQIWIPSTDVKGFKEVNISIDNYARFSSAAGAGANTYDVGVTAGILPLEKFKVEVGVDYITDNTAGSDMAKHPAYFNFKAGVPEDAFFKGMPAVAAGMFGINTASDPLSANIAYGLIAKTFPVIGRLSVGGYNGAERSLGVKTNSGVLASWDRTMSEISDKLWLAVDYQSGNNAFGAVSVGGSWAFTQNVSLLLGVDVYNPGQEVLYGGKPTFTTQLDINF
ncbi:MAG: hypothetical protein PHH28_04900 [Desulfuromonadaceae bacterium]|nr:hypothetical protein [Desulfuromonadaceae bacterium]